ncbi:MAG: YraN family protein, partial [Clostridia bacterium]|nr:YraN family protein [Clostridia bacterium]
MLSNKRLESARLGALGEDLVAEYLRKQGFIIVKRNWKDRFGEIDVIAEDKKHIIFVEVKTRTEGALVSGAEAVDRRKAERIRKTALTFLSRFRMELTPRFDVGEVTV